MRVAVDLSITSSLNRVAWSPGNIFAGGDAGAAWNVLGFSTIGEAIASIEDSSGNDISLANAVTAQQPAYDETEDGIKYAFFDLDDSLSATLPDLGTDASKWTVTPYAVHVETGQTIGAGSYTAPTDDWGGHGVIDREITATEINRIVAWAKRNKLTGVDYPTLKTRMDVICMNAVDVFVYDTTQDSDGGAWRNDAAAQASSWYAEIGEFPEVALIVAETDRVVVYDATDPALPQWRSFEGSTTAINLGVLRSTTTYPITSVSAGKGQIAIGQGLAGGPYGSNGVSVFDFANDEARKHAHLSVYSGTVSPMLDYIDTDITVDASVEPLTSDVVNDVAMTVLSGDTEPTIAVGTDGGVSVIKADGSVVDITFTTQAYVRNVAWREDEALILSTGSNATTQAWVHVFHEVPNTDFAGTNGYKKNGDEFYSTISNPAYIGCDIFLPSNSYSTTPIDLIGDAWASNRGVLKLDASPDDPPSGLVAHITSTYNTGWMVGDVKGCWLCDTDDSDLVGGELVTNGTFDADSDWTKQAGWTISGGTANADSSIGGTTNITSATTVPEVGKTYLVEYEIVSVSGSGVRTSFGGAQENTYNSASGSVSVLFTATTTDPLAITAANSDTLASIDNISVKLVDEDRSVNDNGLIVNGTIARESVADGAEGVAYSGFSATDYLEQPYNADLDFGTGDFCVMGWVKPSSLPAPQVLFSRGDVAASSNRWNLALLGVSGDLNWFDNAGSSVSSGLPVSPSDWSLVGIFRSSGTLYAAVNDEIVSLGANASDLSNASAVLRVGFSYSGATPATASALAKWRAKASAPSTAQWAKIYEDELPLFQEKAAETLAGSGDAVRALAHDPTTGVLRAAQSDTTSLFLCLERVGEEDGKATCIAASNGIVAGI